MPPQTDAATMTAERDSSTQEVVDALRTEFSEPIADLRSRIDTLATSQEELVEKFRANAGDSVSHVAGADDAFTTDDPAKRFNLNRAIIGHQYGWDYDRSPLRSAPGREHWPERDIVVTATEQHYAARAQSSGVDSEGGFAVPEQFMQEFIPILLAQTSVSRAGARFETGFRGSPVVWPKVNSAAQAYWVAENTAQTSSEVGLGQISMKPHGLGSYVEVSNRLLFQTGNFFENMLRNHLAQILGLKLDIAALKGTGANGEPLGLKNVSGVLTVDWSSADNDGADQTVTDLLSEHEEKIEDANAMVGPMAWIMRPTTKGWFRKAKDADGTPFLQRDLTAPTTSTLMGHPVYTTTQLAGSTDADLFLGVFSQLLIGQWGTMLMRASDVASDAMRKNQTHIVTHLDVDVAVLQETAFSSATNLDIS